MIDPDVERQYSDSKELLALWKNFSEFFRMATDRNANLTAEKEDEFLALKSRIAMLHDSFMDALEGDQNIGQEVLNIVSRSITLKHLGRQNEGDRRKMEMDWHESYLLINDTIAALEDKRIQLASVNERQYKAQKAAGKAAQSVNTFLNSLYFKAGVGIIVLLGATIGVQSFGIYDYDNVAKIPGLRAPYVLGKAAVRLVYPDSPWPIIDAYPRKVYARWPSGVSQPEAEGISQDAFIAGIPIPEIQTKLRAAKEFRAEKVRKEFRGDLIIASFLIPDTASARDIEDTWRSQTSSLDQNHPAREYRIVRNYNLVVVLKSGNMELRNEVADGVYGG